MSPSPCDRNTEGSSDRRQLNHTYIMACDFASLIHLFHPSATNLMHFSKSAQQTHCRFKTQCKRGQQQNCLTFHVTASAEWASLASSIRLYRHTSTPSHIQTHTQLHRH